VENIFFFFLLAVRWINLNQNLKSQDVPSKVVMKLQFIKTPKVFHDAVAIQFYWMQVC